MEKETVQLVGPKEVNMQFTIDGVVYTARDGRVTPPLPVGQVPDNLWGLGFHREEPAEPVADA